jgi:hypothetical protein
MITRIIKSMIQDVLEDREHTRIMNQESGLAGIRPTYPTEAGYIGLMSYRVWPIANGYMIHVENHDHIHTQTPPSAPYYCIDMDAVGKQLIVIHAQQRMGVQPELPGVATKQSTKGHTI